MTHHERERGRGEVTNGLPSQGRRGSHLLDAKTCLEVTQRTDRCGPQIARVARRTSVNAVREHGLGPLSSTCACHSADCNLSRGCNSIFVFGWGSPVFRRPEPHRPLRAFWDPMVKPENSNRSMEIAGLRPSGIYQSTPVRFSNHIGLNLQQRENAQT